MSNLNRVFLIGRVGQEPDLRATPGGTAVANFSLATNDYWTDKATGERKERTDWHRIVAWDKLANFVSNYVSKGSLIFVEGSLQYRSWEGRDGQKRTTAEIRAVAIRLLERRKGGEVVPMPGTPEEEPPEDIPPDDDMDVPF